MNNLSLG